MAKGIVTSYIQGRHQARVTLLPSVSANIEGEWFLLNGLRPWAITVTGDFAGGTTVRLRVANQEDAPTGAAANYPLLDQDITVPYLINLDLPLAWVRAEVVSYASGSVQVDFMGG
jgi:hypothetical protein